MAEFRGRILYVPGKNPKPDPMLHAGLLWRALYKGLTDSQRDCCAALDAEAFHLAAWNRHYYGREKDATPDFAAIEALLAGEWDEQRDRTEADSWRVGMQRLVQRIADRFPVLLRLLADPTIKETIKETERYFDQSDATGHEIRAFAKEPLRQWIWEDRPVLVIGHSLGSVIAWDALWELTHEDGMQGQLDFITIGSPLGLHFTQARLRGNDRVGTARYPHLIREWHNIAAVGDLISLDPTMADDFADMARLGLVDIIEDHYRGIYTHYRDENGLNPHRSYGYLVHPVVAARVAAWWWRSR
jgi:hypothetical protein